MVEPRTVMAYRRENGRGWTVDMRPGLVVALTIPLVGRLAGTSLPLFEPSAVQALYQATHGLPRKVNLVAHYALSAAALAKARQITAEHVQSALEEVQ